MADNDFSPEGTGGEQGGSPEAPGSPGGSGNGGAPAGGATRLTAEDWDKFRHADEREVPSDVRVKYEKPFLSEYTRRNQELARREERLFELATQSLANKGVSPTPDQLSELKERIKAGETDLVPQLVDSMIESRVKPSMDNLTIRGMFEEAHRAYPVLAEPEISQEVTRAFREQPLLAEMARQGNFEGTKMVLRGIAQDVLLRRAVTELKQIKDSMASKIEEARAKAVADYKAKALGLPSESSRAGSTRRGEGEGEEYLSFAEAAEAAWNETVEKAS